jgi:hypothetical protein
MLAGVVAVHQRQEERVEQAAGALVVAALAPVRPEETLELPILAVGVGVVLSFLPPVPQAAQVS